MPLFVNALSSNGTNLLAGTYRGVYQSTDNGNNWASKELGMARIILSLPLQPGVRIFLPELTTVSMFQPITGVVGVYKRYRTYLLRAMHLQSMEQIFLKLVEVM